MLRKLRFTLCLCALLIVQTAVLHRFSSEAVAFDLLGLLVAYVALEGTLRTALWTAFAVGVIQDFTSLGPLGLSALLYVPAVLLLVSIRDRLVRESLLIDLPLVFLFVLLSNLARAGFTSLLARGPQMNVLLSRAFALAACTAAAGVLLLPLFHRLGLVSSAEP